MTSTTPLLSRPAGEERRGFLGLFGRKRKREDEEVETVKEPTLLKFLFVGSKNAGQTSMLL